MNSTRPSSLAGHSVDNLGPQLNYTIWILAGLSALLLGLRVYCKLWRRRALWWDDYFLIASLITLVISTSLQSVAVSYGLGKHPRDINLNDNTLIAIYSYIAGFVGVLTAAWSKTSFALTLHRVSDGWLRILVWFIIITINLVQGANGTMQWIQCWPVEKLWHPKVHGSCWPSHYLQSYGTFVSAYSAAMDVALALIPWKIVWQAAIDKREKFGALFAMSLGIFAGITSLLKITTFDAIGNSDNSTTVNLFIFGTAEGAITIMAASIPVLRALFQPNARPRTPHLVPYEPDEDDSAASPRFVEEKVQRQEQR